MSGSQKTGELTRSGLGKRITGELSRSGSGKGSDELSRSGSNGKKEGKVSRFDIVAEDQSGSELQAEQIVCKTGSSENQAGAPRPVLSAGATKGLDEATQPETTGSGSDPIGKELTKDCSD